ncbi:hypothetical protein M427DRAFT_33431 [Gonapodya prolifera JEL478]|uniref:HMG box domain-containing protein n=1 Tax=Gonapodya prolifera (strain JEL478) TaxID=1344416 RepID=A0A139AB75_GONPJ|nr:hypothetical protein M427DRAFT_33431 [Gonapodya prolifera JEL478]|eukprot:KXS14000.1 hypothetical protein M427DRAFT_33431 [Gonapodya prolifera JEL478]
MQAKAGPFKAVTPARVENLVKGVAGVLDVAASSPPSRCLEHVPRHFKPLKAIADRMQRENGLREPLRTLALIFTEFLKEIAHYLETVKGKPKWACVLNSSRTQKELKELVPKGLPTRRRRLPKTSTTLILALPMSAPAPFVLFTREKHPEVKAAFPDLSFAMIPVTIGNMWKALSNEEKQVWEQTGTLWEKRMGEDKEETTLDALVATYARDRTRYKMESAEEKENRCAEAEKDMLIAACLRKDATETLSKKRVLEDKDWNTTDGQDEGSVPRKRGKPVAA